MCCFKLLISAIRFGSTIAILAFNFNTQPLLAQDARDWQVASYDRQLWTNPKCHLVVIVSKHTDKHGSPRAGLAFVLRDENGLGKAVGLPGNELLRLYFRSKYELHLEELQKDRSLEPQDIQKLSLASEIDIARLLRKIQSLQEDLTKMSFDTDLPAANKLVEPIRASCLRGLFTDGSLFAQVLARLDH